MTTVTQPPEQINEKIRKFAQVLRHTLFFNTFQTDELYTIVAEERLIKWKRFQKGDTIFKQGTFDQHFYIIIQGKVEIAKAGGAQKETILGTLQEGELFGEMVVCSPGQPRRASTYAVSNDDVILCEIDATLIDTVPSQLKVKFLKKFLDLIIERFKASERDPHFYEEIIRFAGQNKFAQVNDFFQYTVETAVSDNNKFTQYIKYTDFLVNRKIPPAQSTELLQNLLVKAVEKLAQSIHSAI